VFLRFSAPSEELKGTATTKTPCRYKKIASKKQFLGCVLGRSKTCTTFNFKKLKRHQTSKFDEIKKKLRSGPGPVAVAVAVACGCDFLLFGIFGLWT
jgi:hypothetical protein